MTVIELKLGQPTVKSIQIRKHPMIPKFNEFQFVRRHNRETEYYNQYAAIFWRTLEKAAKLPSLSTATVKYKFKAIRGFKWPGYKTRSHFQLHPGTWNTK